MSNWWLFYSPGKEDGVDYWTSRKYIQSQFKGTTHWTCHHNALPGDYGLLYARSPISSLVAILQVKSKPWAKSEPSFYSRDEWWCHVRFLHEFISPYSYQQMKADRDMLNSWGLVRSQMQSSKGPPAIKHEILLMLAERIPELTKHLRKTGELKKIKTAMKEEQLEQKQLADAARIAKAAKPLAEVFGIPVTTVQSWIPRSATPKKLSGPRRSNKKPTTQFARTHNDRPLPISQVKPNQVMAIIRDVFSAGGDHDREQLIRQIATHLGYRRVGFWSNERLGSLIHSAVLRGILYRTTGQEYKIRPSIDAYSLDKRVSVLLAAMGKKWQTRDKAITAATRHLGFRRTGTKIREAFRSAINAAIRRKKLERDGQNLIRKLRITS